MNETMPHTPFSTKLSGSARETERRLKNIFSGPKRRPPLPFLALVFTVCLLCGNLVSCQMAEPLQEDGPPTAELWLDYTSGLEELPWDDSTERELPEYPGVTFRWTANEVCAVEDGQERTLFSGMPVESVYLWDLTGDGLRELCAVTAYGSGMVDASIKVYDYAAGEAYILTSRGMFDYGLSLEDGQLQVTRYRYTGGPPPAGQPLSVGHLAVREGVTYQMDEASFRTLYLADEVPISTDEPDFAWLLMREHENYLYEAERMDSRLLLTREGEGCTLALAQVNGGVHPAGLSNLMLGLWDTEAGTWRGPVYTVGGDEGEFSSWTGEDGLFHILCANTAVYQGDEGPYTVAHYRFDGLTLEERDRQVYDPDCKAVPAESGLELYEISPQYQLQHYNPEYNGVPLPEKWVYSHFEPVSD